MATEDNKPANRIDGDCPSVEQLNKASSEDLMDSLPVPAAGDTPRANGETLPLDVPGSSDGPSVPKEMVDFKVIFNKQKFDVIFPLDDTVVVLKQHIQTLTGVPPAMQKVMYKGLAKDDKTLRDLGVIKGAKIMVVGSTLNDVLAVSSVSTPETSEEKGAIGTAKEPLCKQKIHRKVLDKGVPDDAMPGIKNDKDR